MMDKQPAVFFAGNKEKQKALLICDKIITIIEDETDEVLFKAYIMQMLLESFEENFDIDIRHGMSFSEDNSQVNGKENNGK